MATLTTIQSTDAISASRNVINTNFANLNTDKAETSALTAGLAGKQDTISGLTASGAELNILDGATLSTTELNYVDGVTSAIQTQIDGKQATLVSWTNIKTINGNSLLGTGDITISGGGVTDHGALTGLTDDDHTQYTKADGTRAFTGKQSYATHPTFSADTELVDKKYVDDSITAGWGYTDEQAQDAVGTILVDSSTIDFTYNDATPSITADIINDSVTFAKVQNINTNRILGRSTAGTGDIEELNVTAIPALIGLWTSDNPQFAGVNVWHATDTTISRVSAGRIAVEWVNIPTVSSTDTLTNKTISGASNTLTVDGTNEVWFRIIPQNSQSTAYTLVLTDSGKHIYHPSADTTARTWTIPANSSVAFPIGTAITFVNSISAGNITIAITTDTLRLAGAGTTGSRTLAPNWIATAMKVNTTEWYISWTNLT